MNPRHASPQQLRAWNSVLRMLLEDLAISAAQLKYFIDLQEPNAVRDQLLPGSPDVRETIDYTLAAARLAAAESALECLDCGEEPGPMLLLAVPIREVLGDQAPGLNFEPQHVLPQVGKLLLDNSLERIHEGLDLAVRTPGDEQPVGNVVGRGPGVNQNRSNSGKDLLWILRRNHGAPPAEPIPATPADTGGAQQGTGDGGGAS